MARGSPPSLLVRKPGLWAGTHSLAFLTGQGGRKQTWMGHWSLHAQGKARGHNFTHSWGRRVFLISRLGCWAESPDRLEREKTATQRSAIPAAAFVCKGLLRTPKGPLVTPGSPTLNSYSGIHFPSSTELHHSSACLPLVGADDQSKVAWGGGDLLPSRAFFSRIPSGFT